MVDEHLAFEDILIVFLVGMIVGWPLVARHVRQIGISNSNSIWFNMQMRLSQIHTKMPCYAGFKVPGAQMCTKAFEIC